MAENPQFGGGALEQEITRIEQELASKRAALELQKQAGAMQELPHEKETLREVVKEQFTPPVPAPQAPSAQPQQPVIPPSPIVEPPAYLSPELKEKVQELVNVAFTKTIEEAVKQAQATNNPALIDAFHDVLADELYNYLAERGKIKKF